MPPGRQLSDSPSAAPAPTGRRAAVLRYLREAGEPLGAADVARFLGVHLNTARFHLETLVTEGRAVRDAAPRTEPGRPRIVYSAAADPDGAEGSRSFRLLAEILTGIVSSSVTDPVGAATEAGRAWGSYLTEAPAPTERIGADEGRRRLVEHLTAMGFGPEDDTEGADPELRLHHCPFREVARRQQEVVCAIHLGLMQGVTAALRTPLKTTRLTPFVTPQLCVATLRRTDGQPGA